MIPEKLEYCPGCGAGSGGNGNWNYDSQCCGDCGYDRINPVTSSMDSMRWTIGAQRQHIADLEQQLSALRAEREWVPVSERWPQKGQLIAARAFAEWDESEPGWIEVFDGNEGGAEFESWMLLPTPPTTEEDGQ